MNDKLRKLFGLLDNFDLQDEQLMEALKLAMQLNLQSVFYSAVC